MRLSPYFHIEEFRCHDGTPVPDALLGNLMRLVTTLDICRLAAGAPLNVISGFRTRKHNTAVGGAENSTHLTCEGADIRPGRDVTPEELHALVLQHYKHKRLPDLGGVGLYPSWVHIDVRKAKDGHLRRWTGLGVGSEPGG